MITRHGAEIYWTVEITSWVREIAIDYDPLVFVVLGPVVFMKSVSGAVLEFKFRVNLPHLFSGGYYGRPQD